MLYAVSQDNQKILAEPKATGICQYCKQKLIPKCGAIKTWHWAHPSTNICDPWRDGETDWHLSWKALFPKDYTEVTITKDKAKHIADYFNSTSHVTVEFQHSPLSFYERLERESFYNNLQWVIHIDKNTIINPELESLYFFQNYCMIDHSEKIKRIENTYCDLSKVSFWWKHPKQWVTATPIISNNIYLDSDFFPKDLMLKLSKIKPWKTRTYIDGIFVSKERFVSQLNSDV